MVHSVDVVAKSLQPDLVLLYTLHSTRTILGLMHVASNNQLTIITLVREDISRVNNYELKQYAVHSPRTAMYYCFHSVSYTGAYWTLSLSRGKCVSSMG